VSRRRAAGGGRSAQPKTRTPDKDVGNYVRTVPNQVKAGQSITNLSHVGMIKTNTVKEHERTIISRIRRASQRIPATSTSEIQTENESRSFPRKR
jgi:hypothetical protein